MFHVPEEFRITEGPLASTFLEGNNGAFMFGEKGYEYHVIASDGMNWEHCSVTIDRNRAPSWEQMCLIKDLFWDEEDVVIQIHPPKSEYVNNHEYCLHLWRSTIYEIPLPDSIMVGIKDKKVLKTKSGIILI
jgi:hypothetical protein